MDYYLKRGDRDFMLANPQNLHPVFSQEKLATALCAMYFQEFASCAATMLDDSVPILDAAVLFEDIKSGIQEDPLVKQEMALCLKGSPSPRFSISSLGLLLMDRCVFVPDH